MNVKHLNEFPRFVVINHHKCGDLKQQKFILSPLEIIKQGFRRAILALRLQEGVFPCFFQLMMAACIPWLVDTLLLFLSLFSRGLSLCFSSVILLFF
jgi:hypothetical protein